MKKRDYFLFLAVSIIAGLLGGVLSNRMFTEKTAFAEETKQSELMVKAQDFRLVDKNGRLLAVLATSVDSGEPFLAIYGKDGKFRIMLDLLEGSPRVILRDNNAQTRLALGAMEVTNKSTGVVEKRPESTLVMFNQDGKLIWSAPK